MPTWDRPPRSPAARPAIRRRALPPSAAGPAYFGKVKDDQLGDHLPRMTCGPRACASIRRAATDGPATARSFILVTPDGERTMNTYLGACVNLTTADIDAGDRRRRRRSPTWKAICGTGRKPRRPSSAPRRSPAQAGRKTSITLSDSFCVERHRDSFLDLIRNDIDIVFANETEIKSLYQTQNFDGALQAMPQGLPDRRADALGGGLCRGARAMRSMRSRPIRSTSSSM